jgi:outer membrane protein assembly factor BamB
MPARRMKLRWEQKIAPKTETSPVVRDGVVYLAQSGGAIEAFDLATGRKVWAQDSRHRFDATPLLLGGRIVAGDSSGLVRAFALDGSSLWNREVGGEVIASANSFGSNVIVGSYDQNLYCLDSRTGEMVWKLETQAQVHATASVADGVAYCGGCDSTLHAVDARTGKERWQAPVEGAIPAAPLVFDGRVVVGHLGGGVACFRTSDGAKLWEHALTNESLYGSFARAEGRIFVPGRNSSLFCLDESTGEILWAFGTREGFDASLIVSGRAVYAPGKDGRLYVIDIETGKELWTYEAGGSLSSGVAIGEGTLLFCDTAGTLYCLAP